MKSNLNDQFFVTPPDHISLYACATFHLGFPLALTSAPDAKNWPDLRSKIMQILEERKSPLITIRNGLTDDLGFPLGKPIMCMLQTIEPPIARLDLPPKGIVGSDHRIIVFPTGTVSFCYKAHARTLGQTKNWMVDSVEHQYDWLTRNFVDFCTAFFPVLDAMNVDITFEDANHGTAIAEAIGRNDSKGLNTSSLLTDVYYIEVQASGNISDRITYTDATLRTGSAEWQSHGIEDVYDRNRMLALITTHASLSCAIWLNTLIKELSAQQQSLYTKAEKLRSDKLEQINVLKNFIARFIYESEPISISITKEFYELMHTAWINWRMNDINEHLRQGLSSMHEFTNWINRRQTERRALRLSAALAFLSALTLISALADTKNYLGKNYDSLFSEPVLLAVALAAFATPLIIFGRGLLSRPRSRGRSVSLITNATKKR